MMLDDDGSRMQDQDDYQKERDEEKVKKIAACLTDLCYSTKQLAEST